MKTLIICGVIFTLLLAYVLGGRAWLKSKPWMAGFFSLIEPVEIFLYKKSETILFARLKIVTGLLLTILAQLGTIDLTPLWPFIPDEYEGAIRVFINFLPMTIALLGMVDEKLRNTTATPIEVVALPEEVKAKPEVADALITAEIAKAELKAVAAEAQAVP